MIIAKIADSGIIASLARIKTSVARVSKLNGRRINVNGSSFKSLRNARIDHLKLNF
jgi:hypothetical protein